MVLVNITLALILNLFFFLSQTQMLNSRRILVIFNYYAKLYEPVSVLELSCPRFQANINTDQPTETTNALHSPPATDGTKQQQPTTVQQQPHEPDMRPSPSLVTIWGCRNLQMQLLFWEEAAVESNFVFYNCWAKRENAKTAREHACSWLQKI